MAKVLVIALTIALANAHNWLMTPPCYDGNIPSTADPCDGPNGGQGTATTTIPFGGTVSMTWSTNHAGVHYVQVLPIGELSTLDTATTFTFSATFPISTAGTTLTTGDSADITELGTYVVRYGWTNWHNCFTLVVTAAGETNAPTPSPPPTPAPLPATCYEYCTLTTKQNWCPGQYSSLDDCYAVCAAFPIGRTSDVAENTLNCRMYYLQKVQNDTKANAALHCSYASVTGGAMCIGQYPTMYPAVSLSITAPASYSAAAVASAVQVGIINSIPGITTADFSVSGNQISVSGSTQTLVVSIQFYGTDALTNQALVAAVPTGVSSSLTQYSATASVNQASTNSASSSSSSSVSAGGAAAAVIFTLLAVALIVFAVYWFKFRSPATSTAKPVAAKPVTTDAKPPALAPKPTVKPLL